MSDDDFISKSIKNLLEYGIQLHLESPEEEQYYIQKLFEYVDVKTEFTPYLRRDISIEIEDTELQLVAELLVTQGTLYFVPYQSDIFSVFTETLKFISGYHESIVREFRGLEEIKIQSIDQVNKAYEKTEEIDEEESSSDDDYEWI